MILLCKLAAAVFVAAVLMLPPLFLSLWMLGVGLPSGTSIGTIGGADGPTAIFVTGSFPWGLLTGLCGCIALVVLGIIMSRRPE